MADVNLGATVTGGGDLPPSNPSYANDGNGTTDTLRASGVAGAGTWWTYWISDLGTPCTVTTMKLWKSANVGAPNTPTGLTVWGSSDGSSWTVVPGTYTGGGGVAGDWAADTPTTYSHWRIGTSFTLPGLGFYGDVAFHTWEIQGTPFVPPPPTGVVELDIYDPDLNFITTLPNATDKTIRVEHHGAGSGQFTINRHDPDVTSDTIRKGNLVKVRFPAISDDPIFAWWMDDGDFDLVSPDEEGGEEITVRGAGARAYLGRAIWRAESFLLPWWPADMATPPSDAIGAVKVKAGTYWEYNVVGTTHPEITGRSRFTTGGFSAYYTRRKWYPWPGGPMKRQYLIRIEAIEDDTGFVPSTPFYMVINQPGVQRNWFRHTSYADAIDLGSIGDGDKPGQVVKHMIDEAQDASRPAQPYAFLTYDFTDTDDSNGDPWTQTDAQLGMTVRVHETYLQTTGQLEDLGAITVVVDPNLVCHAYNTYGRDLSGDDFGTGVVRFVKGVNIEGLDRGDSLEMGTAAAPIRGFENRSRLRKMVALAEFTHVEVAGEDGVYAQAELPDAGVRVHREIGITGSSDEPSELEAFGLAFLERQLENADRASFGVASGDDEATGLYMPGPEGTNGHYWVGDTVRVDTGSGIGDFDEEDMSIRAIVIAESEAPDPDLPGELAVIVELGAFDEDASIDLPEPPSGHDGSVTVAVTSEGSDESSHSALEDLDEDDHPQYQLRSEKGAASGYASLDGSTKLPLTQLPAHASTHQSGGSDAVKLDDLATPDDNTDLDATTGHHGLLPKLGGGTSNFLRADGSWAAPAGGGAVASDTIWDAKGDLAVGTGADTAARLAVGSNGQVLTADSTQTTGVKWAAPSGGSSFSSYEALISAMTGLVHRWKFEEASGNFADSVGSLTLTKSGAFTYGVAGGPVSGAAGSVTVGASGRGLSSGLGSIPTGGNARTIICIYKGKSSSSQQALWSYGTGSARQWFNAMLNGTATVDQIEVDTWTDDMVFPKSGCNVETWHMHAALYDGAQTVGMFFDGQFLGKRLGGALNTATGGNFSLAQTDSGGNQLGAVTIDDLAVFNRALNPYDIALLYAALAGQLP